MRYLGALDVGVAVDHLDSDFVVAVVQEQVTASAGKEKLKAVEGPPVVWAKAHARRVRQVAITWNHLVQNKENRLGNQCKMD